MREEEKSEGQGFARSRGRPHPVEKLHNPQRYRGPPRRVRPGWPNFANLRPYLHPMRLPSTFRAALIAPCSAVLLTLALPGAAQQPSIPHVVLASPDAGDLWARAAWHEEHTGKTMHGEVVEAAADVIAGGEHTEEEGWDVWRMQITLPGAPGIGIYFDRFHIPVGGELRICTPDGAFSRPYCTGPHGAEENDPHGLWLSDELPGDAALIEYRQPLGCTGTPELGISGVAYYFRFLYFEGEYNLAGDPERGSEACQVDVNCPEGLEWQCQRDAVVRLSITMQGATYLCSGAMVNNAAQDCRQLLLSSHHCADAMGSGDWALMKVRYTYEYFECDGTSSFNSRQKTGVLPITSSDDMVNGSIDGSDFLLMEVEDPIQANWNPFYAGWDATGITSPSGVGIHHPSGDRKKISTYTSQLSSSNAYAPGAHWRVVWAATETNHGVTEGGSSGSPIFNPSRRIVGTLTGGSSMCATPTAPDFYGKFSYHWDGNNPIPVAQRLKAFLDPANSGIEVLDGSYVGTGTLPCEGSATCIPAGLPGDATWTSGRWLALPNPARGTLHLRLLDADLPPSPLTSLRIFDAAGRPITTHPIPAAAALATSHPLDLSAYPPGLYFLTVTTASGATATVRFVVE